MTMNPLTLEMTPRLVRWRRSLHRMPEEGTKEFKTQAYLRAELYAIGADQVREMADTGLKAIFRVEGARRTIAFRADMDGLCIREETGAPYASEHEGMMHACGHDAHMAMVLGAGGAAARLREAGQLTTNVVLLFQPAEESIGGAERMIADGALEDPRVDDIYGMHVMPGYPVGVIALSPGAVMASTNEFDIDIKGMASHGAMPHGGADAAAAAAHLLGLLQAIHTRTLDPFERRLITVGRMIAGDRRNIIAQSARLEGILRTFSREADEVMVAAVRAAMRATDEAFGTHSVYSRFAYYPAVVNPVEPTLRARALIGGAAVEQRPLLGAEDFSYYQSERPGVYAFLGVGQGSPIHSGNFAIDESALAVGLEFYLRLMG